MKPAYFYKPALVGILTAFAFGCGAKSGGESAKKHEEHGHEQHAHGEHTEAENNRTGVTFQEGRGLQFTPEMTKALGVTTVEVVERPLAGEMRILAQVFATQPEVLANARMPEAEAERLEKEPFRGAKRVRLDRTGLKATRLVDVIFALENLSTPAAGDFVPVVLASEPIPRVTVPRSAVLESATGTFVYVVHDESYLRTAVKLGARSADFVEIADGLRAGTFVVSKPVEQLWLSELRLTKGGGHSH